MIQTLQKRALILMVDGETRQTNERRLDLESECNTGNEIDAWQFLSFFKMEQKRKEEK